jgi:hypothetical protein
LADDFDDRIDCHCKVHEVKESDGELEAKIMLYKAKLAITDRSHRRITKRRTYLRSKISRFESVLENRKQGQLPISEELE